MNHLINSTDLSRTDYDKIFRQTKKFLKKGVPPNILRNKVAATLFFQHSINTANSFKSAIIRGGGGWIGFDHGLEFGKGENFEDVISSFSDFSDVIVLRHEKDEAIKLAVENSHVPVINAGGGTREHAVAACGYLFNIYNNLGKLDNIKLGFYGTPGINRCAKSMLQVLGYWGVEIWVDDMGGLFSFPEDVVQKAKENGLKGLHYGKLDDFVSTVDVLCVTRGLQKGIFAEGTFPKEKEEYILNNYRPIDTDVMQKLRPDAFVDMILPRIFEIDRAVDKDPRAIYAKPIAFPYTLIALMNLIINGR